MFVIVIATLCLANVCSDKIVTDQATQMECKGPFSQQALAKWMEENGYAARGYRMARWRCVDPKAPVKVPA